MKIELNHGMRIVGTDLWLDSTRVRPLGFISHAHGDHTARHHRVIATPATWALCRRRLGSRPEPVLLDVRTPHAMDGGAIELHPSGHILGASQILIQNAQRIVYTGDFRLKPSRTAERADPLPCDVLIMECTFGKPRYVFPSEADVERRVLDFVERALDDRKIPILLAYAMGKSQEALKLLSDHGHTVCLPRQTIEIVKIYESLGIRFGRYERIDQANLRGKVVVLPPYMARFRWVQEIANRRTAVLTGWAMDPDAPRRFGVDEAIPLSDHADFEELNEYVSRARPSKIYTVHGPPDLAKHLRARGYRAEHLAPGAQLGLW